MASLPSITQHKFKMNLFTVLTSLLLALGLPCAKAGEHARPVSTSESFVLHNASNVLVGKSHPTIHKSSDQKLI